MNLYRNLITPVVACISLILAYPSCLVNAWWSPSIAVYRRLNERGICCQYVDSIPRNQCIRRDGTTMRGLSFPLLAAASSDEIDEARHNSTQPPSNESNSDRADSASDSPNEIGFGDVTTGMGYNDMVRSNEDSIGMTIIRNNIADSKQGRRLRWRLGLFRSRREESNDDKVASVAVSPPKTAGSPRIRRKKQDNSKRLDKPKETSKRRIAKRLIQCVSLLLALVAVSPWLSAEFVTLHQQQPIPSRHRTDWRSPSFIHGSDGVTRVGGDDDPMVYQLQQEEQPPPSSSSSSSSSSPTNIPQPIKRQGDGINQDKQTTVESLAVGRVPSTTTNPTTVLPVDRRMMLSFVKDAVQKIGPAVVRIDTETHLLQQEDGLPTTTRTPAFVQQGQGSGLIFSKEGLVLTNAHVIEDATKVTVTLTDGRVYEAEVKGSDEIVDIAVLKITRFDEDGPGAGGDTDTDLPVASLGDSDSLNVGQIVVAVGSPGDWTTP